MRPDRIVLDTNCLIMAISARNKYHQVWQSFLAGRFVLCVTNEILEEYEEVLARNINPHLAQNVVSAILNRANVCMVNVYYKFALISQDMDDNKFVDCGIAANARYIVTQDRHFDILKEIDFPKINIVDIDTFVSYLNG